MIQKTIAIKELLINIRHFCWFKRIQSKEKNLKRVVENTTQKMSSKANDPNYILNTTTNRYVKITSTTGKKIVAGETIEHRTTTKKKNKEPLPPISTLIRPPDLSQICQDQEGMKCISALDKQGRWLGCRLSRCVVGVKQIMCVLLETSDRDKECTIKKTCYLILGVMLILLKRRKSVTLGYLQQDIKWTTLLDNENFSNIITLSTPLLQMLGRVCHQTERAYAPYWNNVYEELSGKLWLPNQIDSVGLQSSSSNTSLKFAEQNSWFTINLMEKPLSNINSFMMSSLYSTFIPVVLTEEDVEKLQPQPQMCTRKVKLFPNTCLKGIYRTWINGSKVTYNKTAFDQNTNKTNDTFFDLREKYVNNDICKRVVPSFMVHNGCTIDGTPVCGGYVNHPTGNAKPNGFIISKTPNPNVSEWLKNVPKCVKSGAVKDFIDARKAAFSNLKAGNIKHFQMRYRNKGDKKYPSIRIEPKGITIDDNGKYIRLFPSVVKRLNPQASGRVLVAKCDRIFLNSMKNDMPECKLKMENGHYYLCVPYMKPIDAQTEGGQGVVGIDPGVRTPWTMFDGDNVIEVKHDRKLQEKLQKRMDLIRSLRDKKIISSRSYLRRRWRTRKKWNNYINDLHYKVSKLLVSRYKIIGLPPFETSQMVKGTLTKKTKREMLGLRHFQFKERLVQKARGYSKILKVDESYTSQCCTKCGTLKYIGGSEVYNCKNCGLSIGRDIGSSRSIFMCLLQQRIL